MRIEWFASVILLLTGLVSTRAHAAAPAALPAAEKLAPFVSDQTFLVCFYDLTRLNVPAIQDWVTNAAQNEQFTRNVERGAGHMETWHAQMQDAGGKELYVLFDAEKGNPTFVVPVTDNADTDAIASLLVSGDANGPAEQFGRSSKVVGNVIVSTEDAALEKFANQEPRNQPELAQALSGDAPVRLALIGSEAFRKSIEQEHPQLLADFGGEPVQALTRSVRWAALSVTVPPAVSAQLVVQAENAEAAAKLEKTLNHALGVIIQRRGVPMDPAAMKLVVKGDQLVLDIAGDQLAQVLSQLARGVAVRAPDVAPERKVKVQSASNMRQMLQACMLYANENQGAWPDDRKPLLDSGWLAEDVFTNPREPEKGSYVYIKPATSIMETPADLVIIYEKFDPMLPEINVGFGDGHVEMMTFERAQAEIEKAKKNSKVQEQTL